MSRPAGAAVMLMVVSRYVDVALPVPLDQMFTYAVNGVTPVVGARVLVPFSGQRLMGVVVRVHEDAPADGLRSSRCSRCWMMRRCCRMS